MLSATPIPARLDDGAAGAPKPRAPAERLLRGPLDRFVAQIEVWSPRPGATHRFIDHLPDGAASLVFRWLGGGVADVTACGPRTSALYKTAPEIPLVLRVVFRPGGAYPFFGVPMDRLADRMASLGDLWGPGGVRLQERLVTAANGGGDVVGIVKGALVDRLRTAPFEPASAVAARAAVGRIARGERSIAEVARELGLSERHLRRAFQATVGVGPKTFARIARFQRALALGRAAPLDDEAAVHDPRPKPRAPAKPVRWSEVALAAGYFDQAHLTAEFQRLALVSPGAFESPVRGSRRACA